MSKILEQKTYDIRDEPSKAVRTFCIYRQSHGCLCRQSNVKRAHKAVRIVFLSLVCERWRGGERKLKRGWSADPSARPRHDPQPADATVPPARMAAASCHLTPPLPRRGHRLPHPYPLHQPPLLWRCKPLSRPPGHLLCMIRNFDGSGACIILASRRREIPEHAD